MVPTVIFLTGLYLCVYFSGCVQESCQGDILLKVCYHSRRDVIEVLVLEVANMRKHDLLRLPSKIKAWVVGHMGCRGTSVC